VNEAEPARSARTNICKRSLIVHPNSKSERTVRSAAEILDVVLDHIAEEASEKGLSLKVF
jgi:hypothetical protein